MLERPVSPAPPTWERYPLTLLVSLIFVAGYTITSRVGEGGAVLATPFDRALPFVPEAIFVYSAVYGAAFLPLFVVRCPRLFRRTALAYSLLFAVAFPIFLLFPVSAVGLRPELSSLPVDGFAGWGLRVTYEVDPPRNLLPSLHLAVAAVAALATWKAHRTFGLLASLGMLAIGVSTWLVKQHYVADSVAALACAALAWAVAVRGYDDLGVPAEERAHGPVGPALYLLLMAAFYAGAFAIYASGR